MNCHGNKGTVIRKGLVVCGSKNQVLACYIYETLIYILHGQSYDFDLKQAQMQRDSDLNPFGK